MLPKTLFFSPLAKQNFFFSPLLKFIVSPVSKPCDTYFQDIMEFHVLEVYGEFLEPWDCRELKEIGVLLVHVEKFGIHPQAGQAAVLASISDKIKL